jgi:uncharacterized metal-binding protein (TIGR02443 family)
MSATMNTNGAVLPVLERKTVCPVCKSASTLRLFEKRGIPYRRCRSCDFRFATPAVNANLSNRLDQYEQAYLQYLGPDPANLVNFEALCTCSTPFTRH